MYEFMFNKYSSEAASLGRKTRGQNGIWNDSVITHDITRWYLVKLGASQPIVPTLWDEQQMESFLLSPLARREQSSRVLLWCDVFRPGEEIV